MGILGLRDQGFDSMPTPNNPLGKLGKVWTYLSLMMTGLATTLIDRSV